MTAWTCLDFSSSYHSKEHKISSSGFKGSSWNSGERFNRHH